MTCMATYVSGAKINGIRVHEGAPRDGSGWEIGDNTSRVIRGGSWVDDPWNCRSAYRDYGPPDDALNGLGFRVACSAPRALP